MIAGHENERSHGMPARQALAIMAACVALVTMLLVLVPDI